MASGEFHKIALLCGGPSKERGISLNSARCVLDHTRPLQIELTLFYLHPTGTFYELSPGDLYSNTPSDFDFRLAGQKKGLQEAEWLKLLQGVDLLFPLIHGAYGEDGALQKRLETHAVPFVGSSSGCCAQMFNKYQARKTLHENGFPVLPALKIERDLTEIPFFWKSHSLARAVIKPTMSGSSIGVAVAGSPEEAAQQASRLFAEGFSELLLEPYSEDTEFTICVLAYRNNPVALIPLEIAMQSQGIFDYRKKYLPSLQTRYYCPPRFAEETISRIRSQAEELFRLFDIQDCARLDGWVSPEGEIRFSDMNPISGMEQNSFLFQQASRVGLSHTDLLEHIINSALWRHQRPPILRKIKPEKGKKALHVLMGGDTSEKQVSLLSGTNVWLKLLQSPLYQPTPFLLDTHSNVWELPYDFALHHTVEEMSEHCEKADTILSQIGPLVSTIRKSLHLTSLTEKDRPRKMSLSTFLKQAKEKNAFVFLALHGGMGENGTLQARLQKRALSFNGSHYKASRLCMDKYRTAKKVRALRDPSILPMSQIAFREDEAGENIWKQAADLFQTTQLIIKPRKDGCSTGVVRLSSCEEFLQYMHYRRVRQERIAPNTFAHHASPIEMPGEGQTEFLLEPFIETDPVYVFETELRYAKKSGLCEMTIAVWEEGGKYRAFNPSLTIAESSVLSVEEKFQGGTGINITPPPECILPRAAKEKVQQSACKVAEVLGIRGYCRLDLFVECGTGTIRVIEANTLPALSPSTVLYHQALVETPSIAPQELLERLVAEAELSR